MIFNLPADSLAQAEGISSEAVLPNGSRHGKNSFGRLGYGGPCPPSGSHNYRFTLYALDAKLALEAGASKAEVLEALAGHILAQAELIGQYP